MTTVKIRTSEGLVCIRKCPIEGCGALFNKREAYRGHLHVHALMLDTEKML